MRSPRISEGQCAVYGAEARTDNQSMALWRNRMHNEHAGMPSTDVSGANARVSLLWCPNPAGAGKNYTLTSQRRTSELKFVQDFGVDSFRAGAPPQRPPVPPNAGVARSAPQTWDTPGLPNPPPPPPTDGSLSGRSLESAGPYLNDESARLHAAGHARNLGQTFLRAGNLRQAKIYLARAERLLQTDGSTNKHVGDPATIRRELDEFAAAKKDSYF